LRHIDIKGRYVNGELTAKEQIYMKQPPGCAEINSTGEGLPSYEDTVWFKTIRVALGPKNS
jgi:hypothetical protein